MSEWTVRRATAGDSGAVVELRALMFSSMGVAGVDDAAWRRGAVEWFERELGGPRACVVVAEGPDGRVVAGAMGGLRFETPSPVNPNGVWGLLNNVATQPEARRRGLARACVPGVLDWFRDETDATVVELFATGEGAALYEELGFTPTAWPAMRLRLGSPPSPVD
ncbi:GNAT family N-acetyltransferase [Terrabacter sp. MAHUQ-38]|uniref:GNAT family N-acetyltransferase n=1 Tax=unclassified Terrabacter TaxID=2630222 RepID=UPI00165E615E|nr:GNAT family N-acetyltransferase [Terrabacter sp. MAHUQ-38]MBC9822377.1 GNAT family N-acetyltransferase [Terrabacter sp. MAHUQ-38]